MARQAGKAATSQIYFTDAWQLRAISARSLNRYPAPLRLSIKSRFVRPRQPGLAIPTVTDRRVARYPRLCKECTRLLIGLKATRWSGLSLALIASRARRAIWTPFSSTRKSTPCTAKVTVRGPVAAQPDATGSRRSPRGRHLRTAAGAGADPVQIVDQLIEGAGCLLQGILRAAKPPLISPSVVSRLPRRQSDPRRLRVFPPG